MRAGRAVPVLRSVAVLLGLCVAGCGGDGTASDESDLGETIKEGSPEALAIVALVNDRVVTKTNLDDDAGIDSRAATGLIAHRDGADGAPRTSDDDPFDTLAEVDAVKYVGSKTLKQLLAYADKKGYLADELAKQTDVVFSPQSVEDSHLARVAELIDGAQSTIDIAMYSFGDAGIQKALAAAVARGVAVRFVFDTATTDRRLTGSSLDGSRSAQLEQAGVNVRYVNKIMHHKFMLVDGARDDAARAKTARLASGSANWSNSAATSFDENTLFLQGQSELVLRLQREFNLLWEHSRDFVYVPTLAYDLSTLAIPDEAIPEAPGTHAFFTSTNFKVSGDTFTTTGSNEVADALIAGIASANKSIHIASGHMRSRPVALALMNKKAERPDLDVRVYLDDQEYISQSSNNQQQQELDDCLAAAGDSESAQRACTDNGFLYGYEVGQAGIDVRYKFYAYRWDFTYAKQMHHKYMVVDGETLYTGSYNLSDNAEHQTFENMLVFRGPEFKGLVAKYEDNFEGMWVTGREEQLYEKLMSTVSTAATIPIVFDPMALGWDEVTALKAAIRASCPAVDSTEYRTNPAAHKTCTH